MGSWPPSVAPSVDVNVSDLEGRVGCESDLSRAARDDVHQPVTVADAEICDRECREEVRVGLAENHPLEGDLPFDARELQHLPDDFAGGVVDDRHG